MANTKSFETSEVEVVAPAKANFLTWKLNSLVHLRAVMKSCYEEIRAQATDINSMLIDTSPLEKTATVNAGLTEIQAWDGKAAWSRH